MSRDLMHTAGAKDLPATSLATRPPTRRGGAQPVQRRGAGAGSSVGDRPACSAWPTIRLTPLFGSREAAAQHPRLRALPAVLRRGDRTDTQTHSEHGRVAVAVVEVTPASHGNHERPA